jgi:lysophospholipase L1-like esterase
MIVSLRGGASRLLVSVVSLFFTLGLLEVGLRVVQGWTKESPPGLSGRTFGPVDDFSGSDPRSIVIHRASSIPGLSYEMAPNRELRARNGIVIKTNRFGMRGREPAAQKTDSPCRIAVLGDSYTLGLGVREEDAYPQVLEELLRLSPTAAHCQFEVLNFGVVGYSSSDEDLVLRHRALEFNPKVVIIGYVLNDPEIDPIQPLHRYYSQHRWWQHFRLLRLPDEARTSWDIRRLGGGDYYVYLHAPGQRKWQSVVDAFRDIRDVSAQRNIKVLVAIFPEITKRFKGKPWTDYPYAKIHRQVSDLAVRDGFRVIDLREVFSQHPSEDVVLPGADDHPSVLGHAVAAQAIEQELLKEFSYFFGQQLQRSATAPH